MRATKAVTVLQAEGSPRGPPARMGADAAGLGWRQGRRRARAAGHVDQFLFFDESLGPALRDDADNQHGRSTIMQFGTERAEQG